MPISTRRSAAKANATASAAVTAPFATPTAQSTGEPPLSPTKQEPPATFENRSAASTTTEPEPAATTTAKSTPLGISQTVTPTEGATDKSSTPSTGVAVMSSLPDTKQVRFGNEQQEQHEKSPKEGTSPHNEEHQTDSEPSSPPSSSSTAQQQQRGLVSKRGGRYVSPGRRTSEKAVLGEYKTYRSPNRKQHPNSNRDDVPSLCSTNSGQLTAAASSAMASSAMTTASVAAGIAADTNSSRQAEQPHAPTSSISLDPSIMEMTTSPLASHESAESNNKKIAVTGGRAAASHTASKTDTPMSPLPSDKHQDDIDKKKASLSHQKTSNRKDSDSGRTRRENHENKNDCKPSPKGRDYVATPTDFALDYGKSQTQQAGSSFDTSNVLAWLQSPSANGLFSPGGFSSVMNTPHGGAGGSVPRTPRTPTVSTSFFFSDVASLPQGEQSTPTKSSSRKNNIICISPLASTKARSAATPMKDVFSSPQNAADSTTTRANSLPMLNDSPLKSSRPRVPQRSGSKDPSLDAVHMAERDLMEDEDLSVLLQLASNSTPRSAVGTAAAGPVFRSPPHGRCKEGTREGENLPALQLPMIGGKNNNGAPDTGTSPHRLKQKSNSRETADAGDFSPPQLGMRSGSSSCAKEIYVGGKPSDKSKDKVSNASGKNDSDMNSATAESKKSSQKKKVSDPYSLPHPGQDAPPYYGMPPGVRPGTGGSMRVIVGGPPPPPPPRSGNVGSPMRAMGGASPNGPPPLYHEYPGPGIPYPPPPGMYPQYPGPPPHHMGYPPYQSHYPPPPPRHMPMYGAQNTPGGPAGAANRNSTKAKKSAKRSTSLFDGKPGGSNKKSRKTGNGPSKKKNRSPQLTDRVERQRAAETIQAVNAASGGKNDKAAALAAAILRGVTMRPSGKWQAQLYFAGKSRYIGVFDTREKAALAYEIAREKLKSGPKDLTNSPRSTENLVNAARKAAFEGVNEQAPK